MMNKLPSRVRIVEVGPRDGLQNESALVPTETKVRFIEQLIEAGCRDVEVTSFVSPRALPQLADAFDVATRVRAPRGVTLSALVPNLKGLERAMQAGIRRIAVFTAASESFTRRNINMSIEESLRVFGEVANEALRNGMTVRGYLSTSFVCPYEGSVDKRTVRDLTEKLLQIGVQEVSISDTIGAAAPSEVFETVGFVLEKVPVERIALHFHDTYGTALANVLAALQLGVVTFDSSAGGLGGCPFAPGAAGNAATEDLAYMLNRMNISTGIDGRKIVEAARTVSKIIGRSLPGRLSALS